MAEGFVTCGLSKFADDKGYAITTGATPNKRVIDKTATKKGYALVNQYANGTYENRWSPICQGRFNKNYFVDQFDNNGDKEVDYTGSGKKRSRKYKKVRRSKKSRRSKKRSHKSCH